MTDIQPLAYPGVYPKDSDIIPYSPRREFKFMPSEDMKIRIDEMRNMSTDQIVELYKQGYRLEDMASVSTSTIETASNGITVSSDVLLIVGIGVLAYLFITK